MRADTHDGPEQNRSTSRPNTLMQLSRSSLLELRLATRGRAIHIGTKLPCQRLRQMSGIGGKPDVTRAFCDVAVWTHCGPWQPRHVDLFYHLISAGEERGRHGEAEGLGGLEIDEQLDL